MNNCYENNILILLVEEERREGRMCCVLVIPFDQLNQVTKNDFIQNKQSIDNSSRISNPSRQKDGIFSRLYGYRFTFGNHA
jgi:hypothetical protein